MSTSGRSWIAQTVALLGVLAGAACNTAKVVSPADPGGGAGGAMNGAGGTGGPGPGGEGGAGGSFVFGLPDGGPSASDAKEESCATESHGAQRASVDLLFLVDVSLSMSKLVEGGTQSKWQLAIQAINTFMRDPGSAGLEVALQFFPLRQKCFSGICVGPNNPPGPTPPCPCPAGLMCMPFGRCSKSGQSCMNVGQPCAEGAADDSCVAVSRPCDGNPISCELGDYGKLAVPFAPLPAAAPSVMTALAGQDPLAGQSGTPTGVALAGAVMYLREHLATRPGRRAAIVVVTDGEPTSCEPRAVDAIAAEVMQARQQSPFIPTFVVGVFTAADIIKGTDKIVGQLATAGGTKPFTVNATPDLTARLQVAFNEVRALAVPCAFKIPAPKMGALDYGRVNIRVAAGGKEEDVPYVGSADRCDQTRGGWYYDVDPKSGKTPQSVVVCDASCKALQGDGNARVDLRYGCKTIVIQ